MLRFGRDVVLDSIHSRGARPFLTDMLIYLVVLLWCRNAMYILPLCLNLLRLVIMWASLLLADLSGSGAYLGKVLAPVSISGR